MTLSVEPIEESKNASAMEGVLPAIYQRWSPRAFEDRDVDAADLARILEAARWAPSAYNDQPWRFLIGRRGSATHQKIVSLLIPFNQLWAPKAPVLLLGAARRRFSHDNSSNSYALYDLGAATALLTVQAAALGLVTHQMGGFDHAAARKAFEIPDDYLFGTVTALGYRGNPASLANERLIAQEQSPRTRRAIEEIVLSGWEASGPLI